MVKILRGVIRGRTIELDEDAGIAEGPPVQVVVKAEAEPTHNRRRSAAGAMAEHWSEEDDRLLEEIERDRRRPSPREVPE